MMLFTNPWSPGRSLSRRVLRLRHYMYVECVVRIQSRSTSGKPTIFLSGKSPWTTAVYPTHFHNHILSDLYNVLTVLCRILSVIATFG